MTRADDGHSPSEVHGVLDALLCSLDVDVLALTECSVAAGHQLQLASVSATAIYYNLTGTGQAFMDGSPALDLVPHTLLILPRNCSLRIQASGAATIPSKSSVNTARLQEAAQSASRRFTAGEGDPELIVVCGYAQATYADTFDLFAHLEQPIVERFDAHESMDQRFRDAATEMASRVIGYRAMTSALMKQVVVALFRRSSRSPSAWSERFSTLGDTNVARAFSKMVSNPGGCHNVETLAATAGLSRSSFMARFGDLFGRSPMIVLRDLRMRLAYIQLTTSDRSIDQIASAVGYESRNSFARAFRRTTGRDPSEARERGGQDVEANR